MHLPFVMSETSRRCRCRFQFHNVTSSSDRLRVETQCYAYNVFQIHFGNIFKHVNFCSFYFRCMVYVHRCTLLQTYIILLHYRYT